jgi:hypothetical protein
MTNQEIKTVEKFVNGQKQYLKKMETFIISPEDNSIHAQFTREILKDEPDNAIYFDLKKQILNSSKPTKRPRPSF